jgi:Putative phage tail protein
MFWNIVIAVASFVLNLVLAPKPQNAKASSLEDIDQPIAEEGTEIPVVFGTVHVKNPNCVWYGDFKTQAIKGKRRYMFFGPRQILGYRYYLGMHLLLCHGVVDVIRKIWVDDKVVWAPDNEDNPPPTPTQILISKSNLFGGQEKGGGISGLIDVLGGQPGQGQNDYLKRALKTGAITPAFRGVMSIIWRRIYIGTATYLRPWEFLITRIHQTSEGAEQWYDAKAAVPESNAYGPGSLSLNNDFGPSDTYYGYYYAQNGAVLNDAQMFDANSDYIAFIAKGHPETRHFFNLGEDQLRVWSLNTGQMQDRWYWHSGGGHGSDGSIPFGDAGMGESVHITDYGEIMTREHGNRYIFGPGATPSSSLTFRSGADISDVLQRIYLQDESILTDSQDSNAGFRAGEANGWLIVKPRGDIRTDLLPGLSDYTLPWILLHRSGSDWNIADSHAGLEPTTSPPVLPETISLGPTYAYCNCRSRWVIRLHWNGDWEETHIDLGTVAGWAGTDGGFSNLEYFAGTDEVVATSGRTLYVFDAALTTLLRSRTWPSSGTDGIWGILSAGARATVSNSTILVTVYTPWSIRHMYEVRVSDLTTVRDINMANTTYPEKDDWISIFGDSGMIKYNKMTPGAFIAGHMGVSAWWAFPQGLDMNPAHIIRECLTDPIWGMGYSSADIDDEAFAYAADIFYSECFGLSLQWNREERIEEFISIILSHADAYLYLRRTTGKFYLKAIRNDYVLADLPVLDEDDVIVWDEIVRREPAEAINSVTVKYTDRKNRGKDASHQFDNIAQIQALGERISTVRSYPGISRGNLASQVAARDQKSLGIGFISGRVTGKRTLDALYPGDPFRLVSARHNLDGEVMRVAALKFGDGRDNKVGLQFVEDVFSLGAEDLIDTAQGDWENPANPPAAVTPRLVWEATYRHLLDFLGAANTDEILSRNPGAGVLLVAGGRPTSDSIDAQIYVDGIDEDTLDDFAPAGTLGSGLLPFDTAITLDSAVDADGIVVGALAAVIGSVRTEIVQVTAVAGVSLTVSRGLVDTVPQSHATGESVVVFDDFSGSDFNIRPAGTLPSVRLLTHTTQDQLAYDLAPADVVDLDSRAIRPLRPADVRVEGLAIGPVDGSELAEFTVSWANRNRLTETSTTLAWIDATVTPEAGQTTVIEVLDDLGTVLTTHSGLTGTSFAVPIASFLEQPIGAIRVGAERDGYREWQAYLIECYTQDIEFLVLDEHDLTLNANSLFLGEET